MFAYRLAATLAALSFVASFAPAARAQSALPNEARAAVQAEMKAASEAATKALIAGPSEIKLGSQATLQLPTAYAFVPAAEALRLLRAMGNRPGDDLLGMVVPKGDESWIATVRYVSSGYIKDDDARDWKADELLDNIRDGTDEANRERRNRGIPEMEIIGWVERPAYDASTHRLVWSISSKQKGAADGAEKGVNYNTYVLGREGYLSLNWVTELAAIEREKPQARALLGALAFGEGKRYADFNSSTDRVAEFGLAALVAGVAAKKLGLLALIAAFALKFWKVAAIAAVVGIGPLAKFFKRRRNKSDSPPPPSP